ncbi:MAG: PDZ domain-containing protein [Anaerolineales bacterium]|nr:PDZ domain-containing protein [Anaerolineales bacterium]
MVKRQRWPLIVSLTTFVAAMACATVTGFNPLGGPTAPPATSAAPAPVSDRHLEVLQAVDQAVREQYIRADLDGADWEAAVRAAQDQLTAGLSEDEFAAVMRTLVSTLPAGKAAFITRAERIALETADTSTYQGIGVYYGFRETPEPRVVILSVIPDSPAEAAGLQAHDAIYAVDGQPVRADERDTIVNRIRGPADTSVTLTVQSPGQPRRDVTLQRGTITATDAPRGGALGNTGVVYYRVPVASGPELAQLIAGDLSASQPVSPTTGIILDLRLAGATSGWPLLEMLTLFTTGDLGEFYSRTTTEPLSVDGSDVAGSQTTPLVLLIGPDTRGAVEIFAGILQGAGRARLFGLPTPGAMEGFSEFDLPDGSQLSIATSSFRLPDGTDLAVGGLVPDQAVDSDWDTFAGADDDPVLSAALTSLLAP